jgi:Flp pilus assembly protein TadD
MVGDLAAAVACLEHSRTGPRIDFEQALAKLPASLQPFAEARIAAPLYASPEVAENVVRENVAKLRKMEFEKLKSSTISELEKTRGDVDNEELLLREQHERARKRRGME